MWLDPCLPMLGRVSRVRFVAVGDLMVDVLARGAGHGARIRVAAGGSAANAARVAAACGAEATAFGAVGDDAGGRLLRGELEGAGSGRSWPSSQARRRAPSSSSTARSAP